MVKGASLFCRPQFIEGELVRLTGALARENHLQGYREPGEFAERAAHYLCELNAIHPFREGNGRTQRAFIGARAATAGYGLDLTRIDAPNMIKASVAAMQGNETLMRTLLLDALDSSSGRRVQQTQSQGQPLGSPQTAGYRGIPE